MLKELGLEHTLSAGYAAPVNRFVVHARKRAVALDLPAGAAIERAAFDAALTAAAIDAGVAFLPETTATVTSGDSPDSASRTVTLTSTDQQISTAHGRVVLAADGLGHASVRHLEAFRASTVAEARIGLGLTVREPHGAYDSGAIHMGVARHGYVGLVRTADGNLNVAAAVDPAALRAAGGPANLINEILREANMAMLSAVDTRAWRGTLPLTRASGTLADRRVFLLGDAAGYVEPFTGEGMGWAIASATAVVPYAQRLITTSDESCELTWQAVQQRQIARGQFACRILAPLLRRPLIVEMALRALQAVPSVANPLVRRIQSGPVPLQTSMS
jgi:flavin-dependent dehydrogenase